MNERPGLNAGLYTALFQYASDAIFIADASSCRILDANMKARELTGYSLEELQSFHVSRLHPAEEHEKIIGAFENIEPAPSPVILDTFVLDRRGNRIPVMISMTGVISVEGNEVVFSLFRDVRGERHILDELRQERETVQKYLEVAAVMMIVLGTDGRVKLINRKGCEILVCERDEVVGKDWFESFVPDAVRDYVRNVFKRLMDGDIKPVEYVENVVLTRTGEERIIAWHNSLLRDGRGVIIGTVSSGEDITERRIAEKALMESEEKYRRIVEMSKEGIWSVDENFVTTFVNDQMASMLGYTEKEMTGQPVSLFALEEDLPEQREREMRRRRGISEAAERRLRRKDGTVIWVLSSTVPIINEGGEFLGACAMLTDITERKLAEDALREKEERYRSLFQSSRDAIFISDLDGYIIDCNDMALQIFGHRRNELVAHSIYSLHPEGALDSARAAMKMLSDFGHVKIQINFVKNDGSIFLGEVSSSTFEIGGEKVVQTIVRDITEHQRAEEELRKRQHLNELLIDSIPYPAMIIRKDRIVLAANRNAKELGVVIGGYCWQKFGRSQFLPEEDRKHIETGNEPLNQQTHCSFCLADTVTERMRPANTEVRAWGRLWEAHWIPLDGDSFLHYAIDITDRRAIEEELSKMQRLESVGLLAGGIAHDFNNLLQGLLGNITLAKMLVSPGDRIHELMVNAERAYEMARNLTNQLITFSKGGMPVRRLEDVTGILNDSVRFALSGSNVKCEFETGTDIWLTEIDRGQIQQVFHNIVTNACEVMPEGGTIRVCVENLRQGDNAILFPEHKNYVHIAIADTGPGIDQADMGKIFDPYFSTKNLSSRKGTGLGLTICFSIVKNHGGIITVESEKGRGSVFHIYLPAVPEATDRAEATVQSRKDGRKKILFMDDSDDVRKVASDFLDILGHEVELASDGSEAVRLYKEATEKGSPFDAVILDLTVQGGMGGKEAMARLVEIDPHVRAVLSSGYAEDDMLARHRKLGFCAALKKPYDLKTLQATLESLN